MITMPGRCVVMGILDVPPDSFSDGGRYATVDTAVAHGLCMGDSGADYIDVGGESTRPGADRVEPEEERRRIVPVASGGRSARGRGRPGECGGLADPDMARVVAEAVATGGSASARRSAAMRGLIGT